jgi:uncharacterized lipoprotein YddW (UPF0748 family)
MSAFMLKALNYFNITTYPITPVAIADYSTTITARAKRINILANDADFGIALNNASITIVNAPSNGAVNIDGAGNIIYISNGAYTGTDNFTYKVENVNGLQSNTATVSITVMPEIACNATQPEVDDAYPLKDLRGAWIATTSNLDWPSNRNLTTAQQQAELLLLLDSLAATGINSVYLQIRPESDALYASAIEPWSYWLTGSQGTAPNPVWDPLEFAVAEAHKRGMELHAWINPYRAKQSTPTLAPNHVAVLHPDWTFTAGTLTMLDPGKTDVRNYLTSVITDIATRYNVDGIHFDDFFYPYTGMTNALDTATYIANNPNGLSIQNWRRNNTNVLVAQVYDAIQQVNTTLNKNIVFGISPFGIWKAGNPIGIVGSSSFNDYYYDPIAWLQSGKIDYIAPQLYWKISGPQDYSSLSKWWNDQGALYNRHIYPGQAIYRISDASNWEATEIENQIKINRAEQLILKILKLFYKHIYLSTKLTHHQCRGKIAYALCHHRMCV